MTGLLARAASLVVEPRTPTDTPPATAPAASRALVLGSPATAPPVAAALAGSLRARDRAPAALLCVWCPAAPDAQLARSGPAPLAAPSFAAPLSAPGSAESPSFAAPGAAESISFAAPGAAPGAAESPSDAAAFLRPPRSESASQPQPLAPGDAGAPLPSGTPEGAPLAAWASAGARRLAARLSARGLTVRATGRVAWLTLPDDPTAAAHVVGGLLGWLDAPVVTAVAGARPGELDELIAAQDVVVAVRPAVAAMSPACREMLAALALEELPDPSIRAVACDPLPGGMARWRARGGLARLPAGHPALQALPAPGGRVVA